MPDNIQDVNDAHRALEGIENLLNRMEEENGNYFVFLSNVLTEIGEKNPEYEAHLRARARQLNLPF